MFMKIKTDSGSDRMEKTRIGKKWMKKRLKMSTTVDGIDVTVIGKKPLLGRTRYTVLVSPQEEKATKKTGDFTDVHFRMKDDENAVKCLGVLWDAANSIKDPERTFMDSLSDNDVACIAVLQKGPKKPEQIAEIIELDTKLTSLVLGGLKTMKFVRECRRKGDPRGGYTLTKKGKKAAKLLADRENIIMPKTESEKEMEGKG